MIASVMLVIEYPLHAARTVNKIQCASRIKDPGTPKHCTIGPTADLDNLQHNLDTNQIQIYTSTSKTDRLSAHPLAPASAYPILTRAKGFTRSL
jgi:hypothetical protein